jgi:hypothetical protein
MTTRQKQRVSGLQFLLYSRPLHPELFDIYHDHHLVKEHFEAHIWVTGISHIIGFYAGGSTATETIVGAAAELPKRGLVVSLPFRGERDYETKVDESISYMMSFQVERLSPRLFAKVHGDLSTEGARTGLFVPFPEWATKALMPFTFIDYQAQAQSLHVFAYHAFPEELTIVKTQSIFELA